MAPRKRIRATHCAMLCALLAAACQPRVRHALVLDLALSDPTLLDGTARPWHSAGYTVSYRRFYPHLTDADLERYRTVVFLLGRAPEAPSDALTAGDLAMLDQWVARGGVVVLGYAGDGEGSIDRWAANQWLASRGAGIAIAERVLEDTSQRTGATRPQPWAVARQVGANPLGSVYDPFPFDRNHAITVARPAHVLAVANRKAAQPAAPDVPVAAATRLGDGLVIVVSRYALGALAPQLRPTTMPLLRLDALGETETFLTALARWTRRPAEWAHVPPGEHPVPLVLEGAPAPIDPQQPPQAPPAGAPTVDLPVPVPRDARRATNIPTWVRQVGMRTLWTPLLVSDQGRDAPRSARALDSLVGSLDQAGLNLLAGDAQPEAVSDSLYRHWSERDAARRAWTDVERQLQPTSVAWVPAFAYGAYRLPGRWADSSRGSRGETIPVPCALDTALWNRVLPAFSTLARVAGQSRQLVPALALDLAAPRKGGVSYSMGQEYCDAAWRSALARIGREGALDTLPPGERYRTLREAGILADYVSALEDLVADRARGLRDRALRESPGLYFAFRLTQAPGDWFTLGLCRGFSLPDRPLLLFTPEIETRDLLARLRVRGLNAVHAVQLPAAAVRSTTIGGLRRVIFGENDGFWLSGGDAGATHGRAEAGRVQSDSLALLLRRLVR
jgi:hypothetical protein